MVMSLEWLRTKAGHPERSLPRSLRQTESKDLRLLSGVPYPRHSFASAGSNPICLSGLVLLAGMWATVQPKRPGEPFSSIIVAHRFPDKTERESLAISKNVLVGQHSAGLDKGFTVANLLYGLLGYGQGISGRRNILKFPAKSTQFERMLLRSLIDDLRKSLQEPRLMRIAFGVRHDVQYSIRSNIERFAVTEILDESANPQRAHALQNILWAGYFRYLDVSYSQARPFPVLRVFVLLRRQVNLALNQGDAFLRGPSRRACFGRLPSDNQQGQKESPCGYPVWPSESLDPASRILCFVCLLCALSWLIWHDLSRWINVACIVLMVLLAGFFIAGHTKDCHDQGEKNDNRQILHHQPFTHGGIV